MYLVCYEKSFKDESNGVTWSGLPWWQCAEWLLVKTDSHCSLPSDADV